MERELTLAYLAGLFDVEGCVSVTTHKKNDKVYTTRTLVFVQADRDYCDLFTIELGVGKTYLASRHVNKTVWAWRVNGKQAVIAAQQLYPYLRIKRIEVETKILRLY